ncbi:unnamed protein product [Allacma fusca]|uniref:Uncharacterized protein n=1 Tax=Allacma fusca TaxID=39272 RepID=A0A8J2JJ71_9HEXA|nr:unnamed protein product [Allacma fusca]
MYKQHVLVLCLTVGVLSLSLVQNVAGGLTIRAAERREIQEVNNSGEDEVAVLSDGALQMQNSFIEAWIDAILEHARNVMRKKGLNQIELQPETSEFSRRIFGITFHGKASIYEGVLQGLETIHRTGVVSIKPEKSTGDLIATFEVGVDHPTVRAKALAKFLSIGPSGNITGSFDKVRVKIVIRISKNAGLHADLDTFEITELGKLSLNIKGLGSMLNYVVENIVEGLGNRVFKRKLREVLEGTIKKFIVNDVLKSSIQSTFNFGGASNNDINNNSMQPSEM